MNTMKELWIFFFGLLLLSCALASTENDDNRLDHRQRRSLVFFPSENQDIAPIVSHQRQRYRPGKKQYKRRNRRSLDDDKPTEEKKKVIERQIGYLDYDGWQPLNVADPMSNEPTLIYKPPPLTRVHFGEEPPKEKPLYPVVPVNPPVYVIRAEPTGKHVDSVYGTENIDYLHVNPKTDSAKAYSAFNVNRRKKIENAERNIPPKIERNSASVSLSDIIKSFITRETDHSVEATTEKNDIDNSTSSTSNLISPNNFDFWKIKTDNDSAINLESEKENVNETNSDVNIATHEAVKEQQNNLQGNEANSSENELQDSKFSEKSLAVDDDYYLLYDDDTTRDNETQNYSEKNQAILSDPFASIIPKQPNAHSYKEKSSSETISQETANEDEGEYYAEASENIERKAVQRAPLYELLRNFDGVQYDRYVFSASENDEKTYIEEPAPSNFRTRQPYSRVFQTVTGRSIDSAPDNSNNREWFLIETRPKTFSRWKTEKPLDRKNRFTHRQSTSQSKDQYVYNPYLQQHLTSFKPTESLTANSLSELLQIFKYVTTPSPLSQFQAGSNSFQTKARTFRYTKPTEPPKTKKYTTFRYTIPTSKSVPPTEPTIHDIDALDIPNTKKMNDTVAETNSLDGYLFSDSEAAPEYTRPEVLPNVIRFNLEEIKVDKDKKFEPEEMKMDQDAVQRGEIAPPFVIDIRESTDQAYEHSPYLIYQGHSRVKIFGSNIENDEAVTTTQKPTSSTLDHILMDSSILHPVTVLPPPNLVITETTTSKPKNQKSTANKTNSVKYYSMKRFPEKIDVDKQITVNKNISKWMPKSYYSNFASSRPHLKLPNPPVPQKLTVKRENQYIRAPTEEASLRGMHHSPTVGSFSKLYMNYFPAKSKQAQDPPIHGSSLKRHSLSVSRPVYYTKRIPSERRAKNDEIIKENNRKTRFLTMISNPFEYLPHLRTLGRNK